MSSKLRKAFRVKKGKVDLGNVFLPTSKAQEIGLTSGIVIPGMISIHEEHSVRTQCGYKLNEWSELKPNERALEVAVRRLESLVTRHISEAGK